uniref:Uncharacterized protein n=1 Tax=Panagrolaimus sp. PS1159 TaxID=55785 RepID=A0AC35GQ60_9BILA
MFGKSNRQRLKEFKELMKNKNDSDIEQVVNDDNFSIADNFVAEDYIDFMDDFDNPDNNDFLDIRQQYEHVIDLQDFEEEDDAQNFSGSANLAPLYDNAILSDVEFSMGIMALAREKHLSDATINDVLNVFRSILPESNKVPATYNKVKTIVETNSPYNLLQKSIVFCASCKKDICVCGQVDKSILLAFDVQLQIEELLSRYQDIMDKYRNDMLQQTDYMDIHQSEYYRNTLIKYPNMLPVAVYSDGGRYTHTGAFEGWPVVLFLLDLPPKIRYKYSNIIFSVMSVRNEIILDGLQRQLTEAHEQLNTVSTALYNLTNTFAEYQYVTKFKFDFNTYARTFEKTNYEFLTLLHSKKALRIDEIPESISRYFQDVTTDNLQKKFYYLKLLSCEEEQIIVELTVADSIPSQTLHCHSYSDVGKFEDNVYTKFILPDLYCYYNGTCSTVDRNQCLKTEGQLQCTESAFFKCICEINNIQQCQAIAQLAPPNFVHIQKTGNVFTIATRATFYEIIKSNGNKVSRLVPESKIFSVTLNAEDRLKV